MATTLLKQPGPALPAPGARSLEYYEAIMAQGLPNLEAVALALLQIHQRKLYRNDYGSFQAYLRQRWQLSRSRGYQMLHFAKVKQLSTTVHSGGPKNERQARRLDPQGQVRQKPDDDPIMRAMQYVAAVFERLSPGEQHELLYHMRDMLTELERGLKRKEQSPVSHQLPGLVQ